MLTSADHPRQTGGKRPPFLLWPRDPKRFGHEEKWGLGTRQDQFQTLCNNSQLHGGKTFCASLIANSKRAFLFSVCWLCCLSLREFWLRLNEMHKVWMFASRKTCLPLCGFCFSSIENYFGVRTTHVKGKTDPSVSLRWNKKFWTFPKASIFLIVHLIYLIC